MKILGITYSSTGEWDFVELGNSKISNVCFSVCFTISKRKGIHSVCSCVKRKICCFSAATEYCWSRSSSPHCSHFPHGSWAPAGSDIPGATSAFPETPLMQHPLHRISPVRQGRKQGVRGTAYLPPVPGVKHNLPPCSPPLSSPSYPDAGPECL